MNPVLALAADAEVPDGDEWLSAPERETLAGLRFPGRRRDWRLGRWVAKRAVGAVLSEGPAEVRAAADGAPEVLVAGRPAPVAISISHRAGLGAGLAAAGGSAAGCDLELVEPHPPALAKDFFTPAELALVDRAGPEGRDLAVALVWSAKESALKALRQGLRLDTREVEVECWGAGPGWRPLRVRHGTRGFDGWWRLLPSGHVLTVVTDPPSGPPRSSDT
ncbi:MAG TPA: 4'-phosphopantetheinyl transferase superfamily protein [Candidatus Dormibacteraeota bacterium]|nr:4'-phosphopantetheinyl transferase superfamily protein [Candidatus Dormibacteraeota bacterium]